MLGSGNILVILTILVRLVLSLLSNESILELVQRQKQLDALLCGSKVLLIWFPKPVCENPLLMLSILLPC